MSIYYWNGELAPCRRVRVLVGDSGRFPLYWARDLVGTERDAVEVYYDGQHFYLDDDDGSGWAKVTTGKGSPLCGSRSLEIERVVAERTRFRGVA